MSQVHLRLVHWLDEILTGNPSILEPKSSATLWPVSSPGCKRIERQHVIKLIVVVLRIQHKKSL